MKLSKTIIAAAVAASMAGVAGYAYAQSTGGSATNRDGTSTGTNNPNNNPLNPGGAIGGSPGMSDSGGRMNNNRRNMSGGSGINRDGTSTGSNNPSINPLNPGGANAAAGSGVAGSSGTMDSSGRMNNDNGGMRNRAMRDRSTGAIGQSSSGTADERAARADRN